jgi:NADH-quinone oxidoreductase subunit M
MVKIYSIKFYCIYEEIALNKTFLALVFFMQAGLLGVFLAQDGILFYTFWEITLVPIFLILYWFGAKENNKVLFKFFIYTLVGSLAMLLSFIALGINAESFAYQDLVNVQLSQSAADQFYALAASRVTQTYHVRKGIMT